MARHVSSTPYVANATSGNVSVLAITAGSGALSAVSGSPYSAGISALSNCDLRLGLAYYGFAHDASK